MTPTQAARRADALYFDNSGKVSRRWLCDRIAHLEADLEEARARTRRARATREVTFADEEHAIGECHCSACMAAIDPWDAFCRCCGAELGREQGGREQGGRERGGRERGGRA